MSVDQLPPGKAPSARPGPKFVRYDEYIDKQIQATRRMVKTVDVMTALLVMATGTLGFLLVAAMVEHWLVPGGFNVGVRLVLFVALMTSLTFYTTRRLWPLFAGSINPAYAAHAIENDNPSLKNSLLNLLLFRDRRDDITDAVYETLEEQAAKGLTRVPVESAVDRTQLLRLGYVLVGIVAAVALYKIFSPKDPFVSAERVLMPWARIASASRVSIDNVTPGAVTLARGEVLTVSADVRGVGEDDAVVVRYTTADGQAVDRPAPMTPSAAGLRFTGQIPPTQDGTKVGVAQDLHYRIEAGDARSLEYAVTVVAAPTITVERIDYDYPDYTGFTDRSVDRLGDIRAIEGTRVTIHALANEPIEDAAIDFEADGRRDVRLVATGSEAQASFTLELRDDRQTARFTSYVLRFTGPSARPNRDPVKYPIDVLPDYGPEVAVLAPAEKVRDVRLDETVAIEVDARDPDFALADVQLHGEAAGSAVFDERLLESKHTGRFTGRYLFTPLEHDLKPGDVVRYWVAAHDNRTPKPNEAISDSQTLRIVGSDPGQPGQAPQDRTAQRDQQGQREKRDPQNGGDSKEGQQQEGEGGQSSDSSAGNQQGESASADGQSGQSGEQNSGEQSDNQSRESNSSGQSGGQSSDSSAGDQQGESASADGQSNQSGNDNERSEQNPSQQPGGGESPAKEGDNNPSDQQPSSNGQSDPQRENAKNGEGPQNGKPQPGRESSPVSPEGDNDGEAFERIQDFLKSKGDLPKEPQLGESNPGESASADGEQGTDSTEANPNNASETPSNSDAQSKPNADSQSEQPSTDPGTNSDTDNAKENEAQESQSPDGQPTSSEGESARADGQPEQSQAAPESQPDTKPADQWQQKPSGENKDNPEEPPSGGHGKRKNDSQGDQGGDHTGGGEEGAGQKSERDGTGSAGQNQSADEGAGESSEQGTGHNSPDAGQDATSKDPTGQSGSNEKGDGSGEREGQGDEPGGEQSNQPNDQKTKQPAGEPASAGGDQPETPNQKPGLTHQEAPNAPPQDSTNQDPKSQDPASQDSNSTSPDGAGRVPNGTMQPTKSDGTAPSADDANLDYARKQTDLVLETLAEQMKRQKVDKELLDKLGWTEADLKRFLDRWQQLKAAAQNDTPAADEAQRELDDALRSLGLRRGKLEQTKVTDDANRNLRQGYRGPIPLEYRERLKAYERGVSRARQTDE